MSRTPPSDGSLQPRSSNDSDVWLVYPVRGAPVIRRRPSRRQTSSKSCPTPGLTREPGRMRATWDCATGLHTLRVQAAPSGLQVWHSVELRSGSLVEQAFMLHTRSDFDRWYEASTTRFEHPMAHAEIGRFGHAVLPD